ncbi:MAG: hypothetical protein KGO81_10860 [Bacteroidota bacterium]|nr:hypothetical protein [Bacteroidota bacterium]
MSLWIVMLIVQPFLIKYKKLPQHRLIGRLSYFLVPLVLLSAFLVIRLEYYTRINDFRLQIANGLSHISESEILKQSCNNPNGLFFFLFFALFYVLGIINRHKSSVHARYMLATGLTLLAPTFDRIVEIDFGIRIIAGIIPAFVITFLLIDFILIILIRRDYKIGKPIKTLTACLIIYGVGQILYYVIPNFDWWGHFYAFIMKPAP